MMIMLMLVVSMSSSSLAVGLQYGTILTIGGKKMIVVSQENEEVRLKPYKSVVVKTPVDVKTVEPKPEGPTPEWDSKTVITEGVKNVQECNRPMGCPQDIKTGECLEGCSEQKVKIEMTETIIDPEIIDENTVTYRSDNDLALNLLLHTDPYGVLKQSWPSHYGKPTWLCLLSQSAATLSWKNKIIKLLLYESPERKPG